MKVFIGWDYRDARAFQVAQESLRKYTKKATIIPVVEQDLRKKGIYWRPYRVSDGVGEGEINGQRFDLIDHKPFSTDFSFTRFAVPIMNDYADEWVLFVDADVMFRADIQELFDLIDPYYSVMCVKHHHKPKEELKMWGVAQTLYTRKNWSSVMLMNTSKCREITRYMLNTYPGIDLHSLRWVSQDEIGALPQEWNWLPNYSPEDLDPKLVHFTAGTPDIPGCDGGPYSKEWWSVLKKAKSPLYLP